MTLSIHVKDNLACSPISISRLNFDIQQRYIEKNTFKLIILTVGTLNSGGHTFANTANLDNTVPAIRIRSTMFASQVNFYRK